MFPAQGTPRIPYIFFGNTYEGPDKNAIIIGINYENKDVNRAYPPETTIEDIVNDVSDKLGYENQLIMKEDIQKFNVFIGRQKINTDRELGYYRNLLRANAYRIRVERKLHINIVKREIIRDYTHADIQVLMKWLTQMDQTIEQMEEAEKAAYEDYQKAK